MTTANDDASTRFILPRTSPLVKNLAALWASESALAAKLDALDDRPSHRVEPSKAGPPTVSVATADGRRVNLHSRYQPIEEAAKLIEPIDTQKVVFYILGFGLGYHIRALFEKASEEAMLCIFEPDAVLLRTAFEQHDFTDIISSKRVLFFCDTSKSDMFQRLTPHSAMVSVGTETVSHPPSVQLHPAFFRDVETWIGEFASFCRTSMNTLVLNSTKTAENITRNIGWYAAAPDVGRLKGKHAGRAAIIVSAGPSLRKNKHLINDAAGKAVIIAVQTTLKPLLEMGVEPHYVTSLDYHEICTRFYENLPSGIRTELVAEPKATSKIFDMMRGSISLSGAAYAESLLREMKLNRCALPSGATVAHLAFYLAEHLGCDPIIFIGQDLGFSDGLCYTPGTSYEDVWRPELSRFCTVEMKQWEQIARDRYILRKIPDQQGKPMYTEERLYTYLHQFERDFGKSKSRIIDATEGGARKRGSTVMSLSDAIGQFCTSALPLESIEINPLRWDRLNECIGCLDKRREEAKEIERISRMTLPLLEEVRDFLDDQSRVNRAIGRIDDLRQKMDALGQTYDLVIQLTQQTEMQRFERDRKLAASKADGSDRQRRQVDRDIENVRAVANAAEEFQRLMDTVAEELTERGMRLGVIREAA